VHRHLPHGRRHVLLVHRTVVGSDPHSASTDLALRQDGVARDATQLAPLTTAAALRTSTTPEGTCLQLTRGREAARERPRFYNDPSGGACSRPTRGVMAAASLGPGRAQPRPVPSPRRNPMTSRPPPRAKAPPTQSSENRSTSVASAPPPASAVTPHPSTISCFRFDSPPEGERRGPSRPAFAQSRPLRVAPPQRKRSPHIVDPDALEATPGVGAKQ
jgi:hypothetical protein